jgi:hypothetical protein
MSLGAGSLILAWGAALTGRSLEGIPEFIPVLKPWETPFVAKRINYNYEKMQKENKRKKKQAEKLERKRLKKLETPDEATAVQPDSVVDAETTTENPV